MNSTTLQGVFPEPKPTYRRNFIKENVKSIKQMQGILQEAGVIQPRPNKPVPKLKAHTPLAKSRDSIPLSSSQPATSIEKFKNKVSLAKPTKPKERGKLRLDKKRESSESLTPPKDQKFSHRSVQTERTDDLNLLYQTGVIKYATNTNSAKDKAAKNKAKSPTSLKQQESGAGDAVVDEMQNLELDDKDFIKENKQNLRMRVKPAYTPKVPAQPPPTYQRGALPRYLRERREEEAEKEPEDAECPPGHVLLPEDERKETLRVLRQSYADRIQELNMMPVRNDTLRMKKRKMEIEEELKKIDGGIKVFQRPKVYVKINA